MGKFNSAKSSKMFLQLADEDRNPERARINRLHDRMKRRLKKNERLTGDELKCALSAARDDKIAEKLKNGEPLSDFEKHLIVDVGC